MRRRLLDFITALSLLLCVAEPLCAFRMSRSNDLYRTTPRT